MRFECAYLWRIASLPKKFYMELLFQHLHSAGTTFAMDTPFNTIPYLNWLHSSCLSNSMFKIFWFLIPLTPLPPPSHFKTRVVMQLEMCSTLNKIIGGTMYPPMIVALAWSQNGTFRFPWPRKPTQVGLNRPKPRLFVDLIKCLTCFKCRDCLIVIFRSSASFLILKKF